MSGTVEGKEVRAGGFVLMEKLGIDPPQDKEEKGDETKIFILINNEVAGYITFADEIRESSFGAVKSLQKNGIKVSKPPRHQI